MPIIFVYEGDLALKKIEVYAHRGYSAVAPENTVAAFRQAAEVKADGIELDVQLSRDGEVIVIHDETVKRTTGQKGKVKDLTLEELHRLDAGSWFSADWKGEKIPTLNEVLQLAAESGMKVNIELKNNKYPYPGLEEKVLQSVEYFGLMKKTIISSFNHYSLRRVKERVPQVETAILYMASLFEPWNYTKRIGVASIHSYWPTTEKEMVEQCHKLSLPVRPFTVNRVQEMRRLIRLGVDGVITDKVEQFQAELESQQEFDVVNMSGK
ncbi:glycerophosphodiester phosphodiesterase [Kroppenstedtia pulmonis]|uniref:Glycerophosphodiester phosphodiesterase n=1 Tax=Kroppenstedtia pulmonis TaxID=1380685 RepID=A0A7D3XS53_9BACL|nr:glycerophosphodiester phosphodiesterase [Kroppenstedtia pulmonis]